MACLVGVWHTLSMYMYVMLKHTYCLLSVSSCPSYHSTLCMHVTWFTNIRPTTRKCWMMCVHLPPPLILSHTLTNSLSPLARSLTHRCLAVILTLILRCSSRSRRGLARAHLVKSTRGKQHWHGWDCLWGGGWGRRSKTHSLRERVTTNKGGEGLVPLWGHLYTGWSWCMVLKMEHTN